MDVKTLWDQLITNKFTKTFAKTILSKFFNFNPTKHIRIMTGVTSRGGIGIDIDEIVVDVPPVIVEIRTNYYLN